MPCELQHNELCKFVVAFFFIDPPVHDCPLMLRRVQVAQSAGRQLRSMLTPPWPRHTEKQEILADDGFAGEEERRKRLFKGLRFFFCREVCTSLLVFLSPLFYVPVCFARYGTFRDECVMMPSWVVRLGRNFYASPCERSVPGAFITTLHTFLESFTALCLFGVSLVTSC